MLDNEHYHKVDFLDIHPLLKFCHDEAY